MKSIKKHEFEAVSLLTTQSGLLDVTIVPVVGQPDWLIPSSLILEVTDFRERIWNYIWQDQDIAVYHLLPKDVEPDKIIVLEGNTSVHRLALQTVGELITRQFRISEVTDAKLPEGFIDLGADSEVSSPSLDMGDNVVGIPFVYQAVKIDGEIYVVPDIDVIAYQLVDLDD